MEYKTEWLRQYLAEQGIRAMDLVRLCGIGVNTAYRITRGQPIYDMDTLYKVFVGLKKVGYSIEWEKILESVI